MRICRIGGSNPSPSANYIKTYSMVYAVEGVFFALSYVVNFD